MKGVVRSSAEIRRGVRGIRNPDPEGLSGIHNPLLRAEPGVESTWIRQSEAAILQLERTTPTRPPEFPFRLVPLGEGTYTFETVTHDPLVSREKFVEATAEYFATVFGDPLFTDATEFWHTESDPVTETVGAMEGVSVRLQITGGYLRCVPGKGQLHSVRRNLTHREILVSAIVDCLWHLGARRRRNIQLHATPRAIATTMIYRIGQWLRLGAGAAR